MNNESRPSIQAQEQKNPVLRVIDGVVKKLSSLNPLRPAQMTDDQWRQLVELGEVDVEREEKIG